MVTTQLNSSSRVGCMKIPPSVRGINIRRKGLLVAHPWLNCKANYCSVVDKSWEKHVLGYIRGPLYINYSAYALSLIFHWEKMWVCRLKYP